MKFLHGVGGDALDLPLAGIGHFASVERVVGGHPSQVPVSINTPTLLMNLGRYRRSTNQMFQKILLRDTRTNDN